MVKVKFLLLKIFFSSDCVSKKNLTEETIDKNKFVV